jgi:hypothetical protein
MAHRLAGRAIVGEGEPLHVPTEGDADATHYLELSPGGYNDLRPRKPEVKRHSSGMPPPGSGDSISGRAGETSPAVTSCTHAACWHQRTSWQ